MTFSSRQNGLPADLCDTPPVRIVTFSDSSWGKSLSVTFQALREFRQRMSEGSGTTAREKPHAKRAGGTVADFPLNLMKIDENQEKTNFNTKSLTSIAFGGPIGK